MPYATKRPEDRNERYEVDTLQLATDLAKQMGGTNPRVTPHGNGLALFDIGHDTLSLMPASWGDKRVRVSIDANDVPKSDRRNIYGVKGTAQTATLDPDARSLEAIARDIGRRVVDTSVEYLTTVRAGYAKLQEERERMAGEFKRFEALGYRVHVAECRTSAGISKPGCLSGELNAHGVQPGRLNTISPDKFLRIAAILDESEG